VSFFEFVDRNAEGLFWLVVIGMLTGFGSCVSCRSDNASLSPGCSVRIHSTPSADAGAP
jgi:hypothetical protein